MALYDCEERYAKDIIDSIKNELAIENSSSKYEFSFSYGIYECNPDNNISLSEIIDLADKKMYKNKINKKTMI